MLPGVNCLSGGVWDPAMRHFKHGSFQAWVILSMGDFKIGLALGGGVARGWAHIGVLRTLEAAGIVPDIVVGTSIGSVVGGCYVANELDELEDFARSLTRRKVLGYLDFNFAGSGLITGQRLNDRLDVKLRDLSIEKLQRRFVAVATEIGTGHEVWLSRGKLVDAMRASYALPGIFRPVEINGRWLFDGALVNPIPVSVARALGARYVIAVNINADLSGRGSMAPIMSDQRDDQAAVPATAVPVDAGTDASSLLARNGRALKKILQRQFFGPSDNGPGISTVMTEAFNIVQDRIARSRMAGDPPDAVIAPRVGDLSLFDFHRADEMIARGENATRRVLDEIQREIEIMRRYTPRTARGDLKPVAAALIADAPATIGISQVPSGYGDLRWHCHSGASRHVAPRVPGQASGAADSHQITEPRQQPAALSALRGVIVLGGI